MAADDEQQPLQDDDYDDGDNEEGGQGGGEGGGGSSWSNSGVAPMSLDDAFTDAPTTYEDLCRKHIVRRKEERPGMGEGRPG